MKFLFTFSLLLFTFCSPLHSQEDFLLETESFVNKGGWVTDPQFIQQMGSTYLMAHGMGVPVMNASTPIKIKKKGKAMQTLYLWGRRFKIHHSKFVNHNSSSYPRLRRN